jgi:hypothetical protein
MLYLVDVLDPIQADTVGFAHGQLFAVGTWQALLPTTEARADSSAGGGGVAAGSGGDAGVLLVMVWGSC